jgi:predicted Zn-ribbon and HTH transcriptional regulator
MKNKKSMMNPRYDTFCGLYCGACPILAANLRGDEEWIKKSAEQWKMKPEDLHCTGCKSDVIAVFCRECHLKRCARDKGVEFCFECDQYPCQALKNFRSDEVAHHSVVLSNLERISRIGVRKWMAERKARWQCKNCGKGFSWYDKKCPQCGTDLYNAVDEEKDLDI